jgi:DNA-binding NarL/FixJ family response regulator
MNLRILLADAHWLVRRGLRATLQSQPEFRITGECGDVRELVVASNQLLPDLVIIDLHLPVGGGIAATRQIREQTPGQKVLLLGDGGSAGSMRDALRAGCDGVVGKDAGESELLDAIRAVSRGGIYIDSELSRQLVLSDHEREVNGQSGPLAELSERELAVFRLVGSGHTNRGVGEQLQLSPKTIEKYRATLMRKLAVRNAVELRLLALDLGVISRAEAGSN